MNQQHRHYLPYFLAPLVCWVFIISPTLASPPRTFFNTHIRPILKDRCFACHGALKQEANLRVDTATSILRGGDSGPIIQTDAPNSSLLISRISTNDLSSRMPPQGHALTPSQIELIQQWIEDGALIPENDTAEPSPTEHWAFQPIARPKIPISHSSANIASNPIDSFLSAELENHGLVPQPLATPPQRIRRLYLDLIGVPPTTNQLNEFLNDDSPDTYNNIALRLLASPQYGERWARHWMDVWRYADWFGRRYVPDVWNSAPQIWHWRDWIVRSLNSDVGYDQMVREMLAADEINPGDPDSAVATGFLIRNWYALNPNDWMRSNVEHTGKAFLGLTFQCAHCHDHKYDPITQDDYFRFRAFFEPIGIRQDRRPGEPDPGPFQEYEYTTQRKVQRLGIVSIFDKNPNAQTYFYNNGDERNRDTSHSIIQPNVPQFLAAQFSPPQNPLQLPPIAAYPGLNPQLRNALMQELDQKIALAQTALTNAQTQLDSQSNSKEIQAAIAKLNAAETRYNTISTASNPADDQIFTSQSLLLNATIGRRMIYRALPEVTQPLTAARISFDVFVGSKSHFNFQLTRDNTQGLTASFVGFENDEIRAYQPNSFQEFVVANVDPNMPRSFHVDLRIDVKANKAELTILSLPQRIPIASKIPIALNEWNPYQDQTKGILFDARPGALAAVDNLLLDSATAASNDSTIPIVRIDFEAPTFPLDCEIATSPHWQSLSFSSLPADSRIVRHIPSASELLHRKELSQLRRAAQRPTLNLQVAQANLAAAQASLEALLMTIEADDAKFVTTKPDPNSTHQDDLAIQAYRLQQRATLQMQEAQCAEAEKALAECEALPLDAPNRPSEIEKAETVWTSALASLDKARLATQLPASKEYQPLTRTYTNQSTGRRKALAEWITHPENPLTARVAVNHIWMRHFHQPLVPTIFDFGRSSPQPRQLALLNWLAAELVESNWSMKRIHYLIVTSQAFQRSTAGHDSTASAADPDNQLYWRMNTGRLEAEVIRDSILHIADSLDLQVGGQEIENNLSFTTYRRSIYYCCQPEEDGKSPLGQLFDGPDPTDCYRRTRTIVPQQALALTNSPLVHQAAQRLEEKLRRNLSNPSDTQHFVDVAFKTILSREPSQQEQLFCLEFLKQPTADTTESVPTDVSVMQKRYASLLRVLFNHNDFITVR